MQNGLWATGAGHRLAGQPPDLTMPPPDIDWLDTALRLGLAALLGGAIGLEREYDGQDAGFRTHLLVVVGAALFGLISVAGFDDFFASNRASTNVNLDVTRIASYVAPGIGFIGGGAILKYGGRVAGVTTAASLWSAAAVGLAVGVGFWEGAVITTVIVLLALEALAPVSSFANRIGRDRRTQLRIILETDADLDRVMAELQRADAPIRRMQFGEGPDERSAMSVEFWHDPTNGDDLVRRLLALDDVTTVTSRIR